MDSEHSIHSSYSGYRIEPRWLQEKHNSKPNVKRMVGTSIFQKLKDAILEFLKEHNAIGNSIEAKYMDAVTRMDPQKAEILKDIIEFIKKEWDCSTIYNEGKGMTPFCHYMHHKRCRRGSLKGEEGVTQDKDQDEVESNEKECLKLAREYLYLVNRWNEEMKQNGYFC